MSLKIVHDWRGLAPELRGASVALGNFDGLHRGHQRVIAAAVDFAREHDIPAGVISFDPHPRRYFQPNAEPFRVMGPAQRARALSALGVDILYLLPFDATLAQMTDEAFARVVLAQGLGVRHVAAGFDVSFGKDRAGSGLKLQRYGFEDGFSVTIVDRMATLEGVKYSSTEARRAIAEGRPEEVVEMLGRPFAIEGEVKHGDKRGRLLGFPTANIGLADYARPAFGVYAVQRAPYLDGRMVEGVANVGHRPTVNGTDERLEVHLFDFDEDLYGQTLETEFVARIRPEQKFSDLDALKARIGLDAQEARRRLAQGTRLELLPDHPEPGQQQPQGADHRQGDLAHRAHHRRPGHATSPTAPWTSCQGKTAQPRHHRHAQAGPDKPSCSFFRIPDPSVSRKAPYYPLIPAAPSPPRAPLLNPAPMAVSEQAMVTRN